MVSLETPICEFGWDAVDFNLKGVDGHNYSLADVRGERGLLIMFICNHCPYVKAVLDRIIRDVSDLEKYGIKSIAMMVNDTIEVPEDSFANMKALSEKLNFPFPYVIDPSQEIGIKYNAV